MTQAFNLAQLANNLNTLGQLDATDGLTGVISVVNGGTGQSSLAANNVILGNGTSGVQAVAPSTNGNVLTSNGTTWQSAAPTLGIGSGQSYQDFPTSSRTNGVTYTNSTGKPIYVCIQTAAQSASGSLVVGGTAASIYSSGPAAWGVYTAIVPNGSTYVLTNASPVASWCELR
jgi:hypothetical protein